MRKGMVPEEVSIWVLCTVKAGPGAFSSSMKRIRNSAPGMVNLYSPPATSSRVKPARRSFCALFMGKILRLVAFGYK